MFFAGLVAGGLAAAATVFWTSDPAYAQQLITAAESAMAFGTYRMASMSDTDVDLAAAAYNSTSFLDDLAWGSAWLHRAHTDPSKKAAWLKNFTM